MLLIVHSLHKFFLICRIDSSHNREVVKSVALELDGKIELDEVRSEFNMIIIIIPFAGVLCVYRRTLKRTPKNDELQRRLRRSRQQRVFDSLQ